MTEILRYQSGGFYASAVDSDDVISIAARFTCQALARLFCHRDATLKSEIKVGVRNMSKPTLT